MLLHSERRKSGGGGDGNLCLMSELRLKLGGESSSSHRLAVFRFVVRSADKRDQDEGYTDCKISLLLEKSEAHLCFSHVYFCFFLWLGFTTDCRSLHV